MASSAKYTLKKWSEEFDPGLIEEWDAEKNVGLDPSSLSSNSPLKVWWKGKCGHNWKTEIQARTRSNSKCPYCSHRLATPGVNSIQALYPEIAKEWHPTKNALTADQLLPGSNRKIWWLGKCGHEWQSPPNNRVRMNTACPYCSRYKALPGVSSLLVEYPEIAKEWHPTKNSKTADEVLPGSNTRVWWLGKCAHEWQSPPNNRVYQQAGCPFCANVRVLSGFNDLQTRYPELARQWHPTRNGELRPDSIMPGSNRKVWWICEKGHEWDSSPTNRLQSGCPICSGRRYAEGINDFKSLEPELVLEWHPTRNGELDPGKIKATYNHKVWWLGKCSHEWQETPRYRHYHHAGCPICYRESHTSFNEQAIYYYVRKVFTDTVSCYRPDFMKGQEFDIYVPSLKIAIEYDGESFHNNIRRDESKHHLAKDNGVELIRIREPKCPALKDEVHCFKVSSVKEVAVSEALTYLESVFTELSGNLIRFPNDIESDRGAVYDLMLTAKREHSLAVLKPHLALLWHPVKNGSLKPDMVGFASDRRVWWQCPLGHEWQSRVDDLEDNSKCPFCFGTEVLAGFNDLETIQPDLAAEWNYERNVLKPSEVTEKSNRCVWWRCSKGHEWEAEVVRRSGNKAGCPYCTKQKLLTGFNDLSTMHPEIAAEWHPTLNGYLQPWEVIDGSKIEAWWMCPKGHEWCVKINQRTNMNSGCPVCSKRNPGSAGSIAEEHPELLAQWHPVKNGNLDPNTLSMGCHTLVWWICEKGHEWCVPPHGRRAGRGCPVCAGKVVCKGYNDLASQSPDVAREWHSTKNGEITPEQVINGSKKKYWWICPKGHEWEAMVSTRTKWGCGCPVCSKANRKYVVN